MLKLTDYQWVNMAYAIQQLRATAISGRLHRLLGVVAEKTEPLKKQFEEEFAEALKGAGDPAVLSEGWVKVNVEVSGSFGQSSTELDIPKFEAAWFDDVVFPVGHYEFIKPLFV